MKTTLFLFFCTLGVAAVADVAAPAVSERIVWHVMDAAEIRAKLEAGVNPNSHVGEKGLTLLGNILMRYPDPELVKLALEKGASVQASKTLKHYFNDYTFMIKANGEVEPQAAAEVMRLLLDAGADIDALSRRGESLRIYYGRRGTAAALAIGEVLRERGAKLHPDAPSHRK